MYDLIQNNESAIVPGPCIVLHGASLDDCFEEIRKRLAYGIPPESFQIRRHKQ